MEVFEGYWGDIGWELQRCKKPEYLINIFNPLAETYIRDIISVFCLPSTEAASASLLREVRTKLRDLDTRVGEANDLIDQFERIDSVFAQAPKSTQQLMGREQEKRWYRALRKARELREISDSRHCLQIRLRKLEASFARQELFRFLQSKRYELNPISLANAAAGLPYIGWRRSMARNKKIHGKRKNGLWYQIFQAICYLAATASKKTENALVMKFREGIPALPNRYSGPKLELAKKWFYLERAIRQACRNKPFPKALPFEIMKQYAKQFRSYSPGDVFIAEQHQLKLS